ncbi:hypothetical protein MMC28_009039 [Mycoblastus sanguinarius]|nr:hypothetical protein [Mycoblastus sanguinarius]
MFLASVIFSTSFTYEQGATVTAEAKFTASIPDPSLINGLTIPPNCTILAADSYNSVVYSINTNTGAYKVVVSDPLKKNNGPVNVNGIKDRGSYLYFTSSGGSLVAKFEIDLTDGTAKGAATVVARFPDELGYNGFNLDNQGNTYMAIRSGDEISMISEQRDAKDHRWCGQWHRIRPADFYGISQRSGRGGLGVWHDWG